MSPRLALPLSLLSAALLAGCASGVKLSETAAPVETRAAAAPDAAPAAGPTTAQTASAAQSQVATVDLGRGDALAEPVSRLIYFDFDSFVVRPEFGDVVETHARRLGAEQSKRLTVEGHADERGSREYNLALGQRRAEAVVRSLVLLGADPSRLEPISFGEERPAAQGSHEEAWAQNRRAELRPR